MPNSDQPANIRFNKVSRYFGEHAAVVDLDLDIQQGEIIGLLGLNGAGKSTCLQMLAGTLAPSLGKIDINGHDLYDSDSNIRSGIGYLPEHPPLYQEQSVDEFLTFIADLYGLDRSIRAERIAEVKKQCSLGEVGKRRIGNLSKGYQQRIGVAQAILTKPKLVILDEPTVGLDPQQLQNMRKLVRNLGESSTVIFSSHMLSEVHAVADRILILHKGKLVHDGPNEDKDDLEQLFAQIIFSSDGLTKGEEE